MFCTNCGTKAKEESNFCHSCGQRVENSSMAEASRFTKEEDYSYEGSSMAMGELSVSKGNYLEILKTFFMGMFFVTFGAYFGINFLPYSVISMINILFIIFMIASIFISKGDIIKNKVSMYIYCFILGIIFSVSLAYYVGSLGSDTFMMCVFGVMSIFGISYMHAKNSTEEDIFSMGGILTKCLIALIIFEFANIFFFGFGIFDAVISGAAIAVYSGYTLFTMKAMQVRCSQEVLSENEVVIMAMSLITSFINLLLHLLRLLSVINSND